MMKKILSVALMATLLLSMVVVAQAETKTSSVAYVIVGNGSDLTTEVVLTPPGNNLAAIKAEANGPNLITIKGDYDKMQSKTFRVGIVLDSTLDTSMEALLEDEGRLTQAKLTTRDHVVINNVAIDLTKSENYSVAPDGQKGIVWTTFVAKSDQLILGETITNPGNGRTYKVTIIKNGGASTNYTFEVVYEDVPISDGDVKEAIASNYYSEFTSYSPGSTTAGVAQTLPAVIDPVPVGMGNEFRVTASSLNVRSAAASSAGIVGKLALGTVVQVEEMTGSWAKISYNGAAAYVYSAYLLNNMARN